MDQSRRKFLTDFAALSSALFLPAGVSATESSGDEDENRQLLLKNEKDLLKVASATNFVATEDNILGPYYRPGAPYRAKITPVAEPGVPLLVQGRVWSLETKKPIAGCVIEIWQANDKGRYDNDDSAHPPAADFFACRARLITNESGQYEFESIHPGRYRLSQTVWRPAHVHFMVAAPNHKTLVTQLYFDGDPYNDKDQFVKKSLIRTPKKEQSNGVQYELVSFDIVLAAGRHSA